MNKKFLEEIKKQLLAQKQELLSGVNKTVEDLHQFQSKDELADFTDQSSMESDRSFLLRMNDRDRNLLDKIDRTLEKIEGGSYGTCEECGCEIDEKRLRARPVVSLCIDCKTEQEKRERFS